MMIQTLSNRFRRVIAVGLYLVFYGQMLCSLAVMGESRGMEGRLSGGSLRSVGRGYSAGVPSRGLADSTGHGMVRREPKRAAIPAAPRIGGPNSPEASSFKTVNSDNLVNLFTGDFSYSIPLLDVGGYPVNIFYNGGISMEQEASWVGLGWNINPGSVSRNMRGVPDDFDGTDTLVQTQNVKPNETWGGSIGADAEELGIKNPNVALNLGFSWNNYLGPAMDLGADVSVSIPILQSTLDVDQATQDTTQLKLNLGVNAKLSSRSGLTLAPSINANMSLISKHTNEGVGAGLSTSYNSRTGIQSLNLTSQVSLSGRTAASTTDPDKKQATTFFDNGLTSTSITFARPSYMPTLRMPMEYDNFSGQLEFGGGMFGLRGAVTAQGYYSKSYVAPGNLTIYKPLVGYIYLQNARQHSDAVMDFNRLNDGAVTPNTPIIAAPQYDYDIFTIQGEGTGGSIRAYRNDLGFVRDNLTTSKDKNISIGVDLAPPGHFGGNVNTVSTPTMSGGWDDGNNTLNYTLQFMDTAYNSSFENVYFRNPGETTVTNNNMINKIGQDNLVRFLVDGTPNTPTLESKMEQFSKNTDMPMGTIPMTGANTINNPASRDKRTQVVTMLTAAQASSVGLDDSIRSYNSTLGTGNNLSYNAIPRVGGYRKGHHISEITVLESNGSRYVYGLPVYNTMQQDFTFSVRKPGNYTTNLVGYASDEPTPAAQEITGEDGIDGYMSMQQTPAYAASFLITGLLSPDYVDVTGNGITEDDLGNAVKFDYAMSNGVHQWRTPRTDTATASAHFNIGLKTEQRDDKAVISYGTREGWYLHAIESKTLIAIFSTSPRNDDKGVMGSLNGMVNPLENVNMKLDSISLYTKAEIKAFGLPGAVPIKTVHFDYSYTLCKKTPDNGTAAGGKLTLNDIYFTFNGQSRVSKDMYVFNYGDTTHNFDNAPYSFAAADKWGTYKPMFDSSSNPVNPAGQNNIDYPYTSTNKAVDDQYAGEWSLKKVLLPSGGQIEVTYEADDYAYVQDRRACNMFNIYGFGTTTAYTNSNMLYTVFANTDQNYVYIQLPTPLINASNPTAARQEIYAKYLETLNQLAFKLNINMPKGMETLTTYASIMDYGLCSNSTNGTMIYIELTPISGAGALANASVQFLINNLPGQAFPGYDLSGVSGVTAFLDMVGSMLSGFFNAFTDAVNQVRSQGYGSTVSLANSFVRLCSPTFIKYGGGHRVKRVLLKDNWNAMTQQYNSQYGQDYFYTTTADVNGVSTTISSGVASYEPGIGSEENPFREILQFENKLPLASAQYGAIEMPVLEAFYPSPVVGYSKVTVKSINRNGTHGDSIVRSAIGSQVSEFYTAKDYPSFWNYTPMNSIDYHHAPAFTFFNKETIDRRTISQGFLVETNDMHGKIKSQTVYSESDPNTPLSYTLHYYKNTGGNGLNDLVNFVNYKQAGAVSSGNMGVDMELMTDVREFSSMSTGNDLQGQVDFFTFVPWPIPGIFVYNLSSYTENTYKAVTTTKLINYHAIEDSVIVDDKGSVVTTKTLAYDAETGTPLVTQTANEFRDPIYNITYPGYWAYSGMAPAYSNIGMTFIGANFNNGQLTGGAPDSVFESGDELYLLNQQWSMPGCVATSAYTNKIWVFDLNKNSTDLTVPSSQRSLVFMDSIGRLFTGGGVNFMIVRSGKRNNLGLTAGTVTAMVNPLQLVNGSLQLVADSADSVVSAAATAYKEKWQVDPDEVQTTVFVPEGCTTVETPSCSGTLPAHINPYVKGLIGNYKPYRSYVYYGSRMETNPAVDTRIRHNGYIQSFGSYWNFNTSSDLVPAATNSNWLWNTQVTKVNSKGQELETEDALGRYTAAQYGYQKNFPVAVVQNARDGQSFYEGFEDYKYNETLNNAVLDTCLNTKYLSFAGLTNSSIVNTDTGSLAAHTGQYFLKVNSNMTATVPLPVAVSPIDTFNFNFKADTARALYNVGGNVGSITTSGYSVNQMPNITVNFSNGGFSCNDVTPGLNPEQSTQDGYNHSISIPVLYYINVPQSGTYTVSLSASMSVLGGQDDPAGSFNVGLLVNVQLKNLQTGVVIPVETNPNPNSPTSALYTGSISLCQGIYEVIGTMSDMFSAPTSDKNEQGTDFSFGFISGSSIGNDYKTDSTNPSCIFTDPIRATDSMLNQQFAVVPGQQMQFSAWVRQDCGTPCYLTSYPNASVILQFPGSISPTDTIKTTGVIVDGWQKVEGAFTVPANATTANLLLGSTSSSVNAYFDDIRIHPFNADMKSYIYDPQSLRLLAEMDENNYATFYNYNEEGQLVRVKKETMQGIKTIKETRTAKQKVITSVQ